ncbi:MAG: ABC transporter permease [Coriobacteriia bacterium]|nr:ABC transporter permease [Coriobacteriia bacterium]
MTKQSKMSPEEQRLEKLQEQSEQKRRRRDKDRNVLQELNRALDAATRTLTKGLIRGFGNERWQSLTIPLLAIALSLVAISILVLMLGSNPLNVFTGILAGAGWIPKPSYGGGQSQLTDLISLSISLTPLLFGALGFVVAMRAGLFNIGIAGQMVVAGFAATVLVGYSDLPALIARPLVLVVGAIAGALAGALIGFLKHRFNIHEVVSSIMLNNIFIHVASYLIKANHLNHASRNMNAASAEARLLTEPVQFGEVAARLPVGFLVAIAMSFILWLFLTKTKQGFEMSAVGKSPKAAQYAGIKIGPTIVFAMALSGAMGGLAGVTHYLANVPAMTPDVLPALGFDSIAVAFLGVVHPLGAILAATLIATLSSGAVYMGSVAGVRHEVASVITGLILLFTACGGFLRAWLDNKKRSFADDENLKGGDAS